MQKSKLVVGLVVVLAAGVFGWFGLSSASKPNVADAIEDTEETGSGPLDGMTFSGALGPNGKPKDIKDSFVFANGRFVSKECELRCKYPARPYFVRSNGNQTEFVSETKCPYKDATIIWRGTIRGDTIKGVSTWTVKRWYWTIESNFEFEGKLIAQSTPVASTE